MLVLTTAVIFCCLIISYCITKSIFHPAVLVNGLWGVLLALYLFCDHPLWNLSDKFCSAVLIWVLPFSIISLLLSQCNLSIGKVKSTYAITDIIRYNNIFPYVFVYSVVLIFAIIYYSGGLSFAAIRSFMVEEQFPPLLTILLYLNTFLSVYVIYGILNVERIGYPRVVLITLMLLILSIVKSNKTSFLALFISIIYILYRKRKLKVSYVILLVLVLFALLYVVTINRADYDFEADSALETFLYIYLLSPLTAFDLLLNGGVSLDVGTYGSGTLAFVYKIINTFGGDCEIAELGTWVNVPLPTNVFTVMRGYYLNNGFFGIFAGSIVLGVIWGLLYRLQNKGYIEYVVFYATMISSLLFQSFGDYFFYSFSMTIQYYIFSLLVVRGLRLRRFVI